MKLLTRTEQDLKDYIEKHILTESMNFEIVRINKYRVLNVWEITDELDFLRLSFNLPAHVMEDEGGNIFFVSESNSLRVTQHLALEQAPTDSSVVEIAKVRM